MFTGMRAIRASRRMPSESAPIVRRWLSTRLCFRTDGKAGDSDQAAAPPPDPLHQVSGPVSLDWELLVIWVGVIVGQAAAQWERRACQTVGNTISSPAVVSLSLFLRESLQGEDPRLPGAHLGTGGYQGQGPSRPRRPVSLRGSHPSFSSIFGFFCGSC